MQTLRTGIGCVLLWTAAAAAQFQGLPKPVKPEDLPPREAVAAQIQAAKEKAARVASPVKRLDEVVGWMDGEPITMDELLDEVLLRFGAPLVPALAQQELMRLEVLRRGVTLTEEEFLEEVRYYLAQLPEKVSLQEHLARTGMDWATFEGNLRIKGAIHKLVRRDQNLKDPGPPNPFLVQIWAGPLRQRYQLVTEPEKLPPGVVARVRGTWETLDFLRYVARAKPAVRRTEGKLVVCPAETSWPRFELPPAPVPVYRDAKNTQVALGEFLAQVAQKAPPLSRWSRVEIQGEPVTYWPDLPVERQRAGQGSDTVPLREVLKKVLAAPFRLVQGGRLLQPAAEKWPRFLLPQGQVRRGGPTGEAVELLAAVQQLLGRKGTVQDVVCIPLPEGGTAVLPNGPVPVRSQLDRMNVLRFLLGQLKLAHFEDALESLARFKAIKKAFAGYRVGEPRGEKPNAPWGVIRVDEKAVQRRIQKERQKYAGTIFTWEVVCQILGKTVPEEMRRFWVGNGVDQIIGTDVDEATLKGYYEKHLDRFAVATVEAEHILIQKRDPRTGRIQWEKARQEAERILAMIRTGADFAAMAKKYSEDTQTRDKGGDLGLFALESRYDPDLCRAAFQLEPGQVSPKPVRTRLGYHIIRVRKKTPPDTQKYSWDSEGMREKVREAWQEERRQRWLAEHVYGKMQLKSRLEEIFLR